MVKTKIEWCDSTWNPVTGCRHGCPYCYARGIAQRFGGYTPTYSSAMTFDSGNYELAEGEQKYKYVCGKDGAAGKKTPAPYPFGFEPTLHRYRLNQPQKWIKPQNVFVCSMADLFGEWVPDSWIEAVFEACEEAPQHRYLFLTKNPERMMDIMGKVRNDRWWFGTTITKPEDYFVTSTAKDLNTFLSIEPLLEDFGNLGRNYYDRAYDKEVDLLTKAKWVIIGAETGNRKDKVVPKAEWVQHITDRCNEAGVPVFMKDSLIPIMGEDRMRREFPWEIETMKKTGQEAGAYADQPTMIPGA